MFVYYLDFNNDHFGFRDTDFSIKNRQSSTRRWRVGLAERYQRVTSEVLLAPMDTGRDDP